MKTKTISGSQRGARRLLSRVIPFEKWKERYSPSEKSIAAYKTIVKTLKGIAKDGSPAEIRISKGH